MFFPFGKTIFVRLFSRSVNLQGVFSWPGILVSDTSVEKKNASTRSEVHNQNLELWSLSSLDNLFLLECNTSSAVTSEEKKTSTSTPP